MEKSSIKSSIEQAHEQNNKLVKIDCSATDLPNDDDEDMEIPHHHEETDAFEKQFCEDVKLLCDAMRELGNPFTDTEGELLHIISKTIMAKESVHSVKKVVFGIKRTSRVRNIDFRDVYLNPYICFSFQFPRKDQ